MTKETIVCLLCFIFLSASSRAATSRYGDFLCKDPRYNCVEVQKGASWAALWKDPHQRQIVMHLNRINTRLHPGMKLAVPNDLESATEMDIAPFPPKIDPPGQKLIQVDLSQLAWAAYDEDGKLLRWAPVSGGRGWCADIQQKCFTVTGEFSVIQKGDASCKSKTFPVPNGGAPMPYCIFFHGGYAIHGSAEVPGFNASHGCVRSFTEDVKWLNQHFARVGTKVVVLPAHTTR